MFQKNAMLHVGLKIHSRTRKHPKLALDHSSHARKRKKLPSAWLDRDVVVHLSWCHCHRLELLAFCASLWWHILKKFMPIVSDYACPPSNKNHLTVSSLNPSSKQQTQYLKSARHMTCLQHYRPHLSYLYNTSQYSL